LVGTSPTGSAEIVGDDFPVLHARRDSASFALHTAMTKSRLHTSTPAISKSDSTLVAVPTDFASYDVIQPPISPEVPLLKK
jgi:hypothetical protein